MKARRRRLIAEAAAVAMIIGVIAPQASAVNLESGNETTASLLVVEDALDGVREIDASLVAEPSGLTATADGLVARSKAGTIEIAVDSTGEVALRDVSGSELRIALPYAAGAEDMQELDSGGAVFASPSTSNVVIPTESKVQMLTVIDGPEAPTAYDYTLDLAPGQVLVPHESGGASVINSDGSIETIVSAPWAIDASGESVPTRYEVRGSTLTQIVEHSAGADVAYPVVADPVWLAPWVLRCLLAMGANSSTISVISQGGSPAAIIAAGGYAALRCAIGR